MTVFVTKITRKCVPLKLTITSIPCLQIVNEFFFSKEVMLLFLLCNIGIYANNVCNLPLLPHILCIAFLNTRLTLFWKRPWSFLKSLVSIKYKDTCKKINAVNEKMPARIRQYFWENKEIVAINCLHLNCVHLYG